MASAPRETEHKDDSIKDCVGHGFVRLKLFNAPMTNVSSNAGSADDGEDEDDCDGLLMLPSTEPPPFNTGEPLNPANFHLFFSLKYLRSKTDYLKTSTCGPFITFAELKSENEKVDIGDRDLDALRLHELIDSFIGNLEPQMIKQLVDTDNADTVMNLLYPGFHNYFMSEIRQRLKWPTHRLRKLMHLVFEMIVRAIRAPCGSSDPNNAEWLQLCQIYAHRAVKRALREEKRQASESLMEMATVAYWKRRDKYASPTRHLEDDVRLTPVEKARVFMNALRERNSAGARVEWKTKDEDDVVTEIGLQFHHLIMFKNHHRDQVLELFYQYQNSSVSDVLRIMDLCTRVRAEQMTGEGANFTDEFYPLKGCNLAFFCEHVDAIIENLKTRYWSGVVNNLK